MLRKKFQHVGNENYFLSHPLFKMIKISLHKIQLNMNVNYYF